MKAHWDAWYTTKDIEDLASRGVEMVRLPVGDWTLMPYGPYVGCMDGAADRVQWMLDTCAQNNIKVLIDVHAMKDSQNGFDNSGQAKHVEWIDDTHFSHWPNQQANWMGNWNLETNKYDVLNYDNLDHALDVAEGILGKWGSHSAFGAF
jgi:glucan 1,3-beta-glucosidase